METEDIREINSQPSDTDKLVTTNHPARTPAQLVADESRRQKMVGNQHAKRARIWRDALRRELYRRDETGERMITKIARETVKAAAVEIEKVDRDIAGVVAAARRDIGDRIDGKPTQSTEISGPGGSPITLVVAPADLDSL